MDCVFCGKEVDLSPHTYYPGMVDSGDECRAAHLSCRASAKFGPLDEPDATDPSFTLESLVWSCSEVVVVPSLCTQEMNCLALALW